MEEPDELRISSPEEYRQALLQLKAQFSQADLRLLQGLYRSRNNTQPMPVAVLAKMAGLTTADAANKACFRLARLLQGALPGKETGLEPSARCSFADPALRWEWRMGRSLAR